MAKHSSNADLFLEQLYGWNIIEKNYLPISSLALPLNAEPVDFRFI